MYFLRRSAIFRYSSLTFSCGPSIVVQYVCMCDGGYRAWVLILFDFVFWRSGSLSGNRVTSSRLRSNCHEKGIQRAV